MGGRHINYTYGNTLTIKSSPSNFEFHGKPNSPNVVLASGSRTKQYISTNISINQPSITNYDGELVVEHTLTTNYGKKLLLYFPLITDKSIRPNIVDQMILANPGDSLEVNLNMVLEQRRDFIFKDDENIAIYTTPIRINTRLLKDNEPIIEGVTCTDTTSSDVALLKSRMDAVEKHANNTGTYKHGATGGGGGGVGATDTTVTTDMMNELLKSGMKCDALPVGEQDDYVAKLLDVDPASVHEKLDLTNPIAYMLGAIIATTILYMSITSVYKKLFTYLLYKQGDQETSLKDMHLYEGAVGFLLIFFCFIFLFIPSIQNGTAAGLFLCSWLIYVIVVGISRKNIITEVASSSYVLDEHITKIMGTMSSNMFLFYPFYPVAFANAMYKRFYT
jgi:hypothetical protein